MSARRAGSAAAWRRRTYSRPRGASEARRGERWHFHPSSAGRFGGRGALRPFDRRSASLPAVAGVGVPFGREVVHSLRSGRLARRRQHSTRLETRTKECNSRASIRASKPVSMRNEGEGGTSGPPRREPLTRRTVDRSVATPWRDSSESVAVATRKMVNYA